jgi:hypothetical protein
MGFLDRLKQAADVVQQQVQQQVNQWQDGQQPDPYGQQGGNYGPPPPGQAWPPQPFVQAPPFPMNQPVPQGFRLERGLSASVATAYATSRRWPASRWTGNYPHLGADRFECVLSMPPGTAGPAPMELSITLDPFRPNGGYRTPSFDNAVTLRDQSTGRTWQAGPRGKGIGVIVVNPDGMSGRFRRFYLRAQDNPGDRSSFVILDGDWRAAA